MQRLATVAILLALLLCAHETTAQSASSGSASGFGFNATQLWQVDWYTNWPRDFTTARVSPDGSSVYFQGAYNCGYRMTILKLNANNGALIWNSTVELPEQCATTSPIAMDSGLLFATRTTHENPPSVQALSEATGNIMWTTHLGADNQTNKIDSEPAAAFGIVLVGVRKRLHALNATTGDKLWAAPTDNFCTHVALVKASSSANPVAICADQPVRAFDALTGRPLWTYSAPGGSGVTNWWIGRMLIADANPTQAQQQRLAAGLPQHGSNFFGDTVVFNVNANDNPPDYIVALDVTTGANLWTFDMPWVDWVVGDANAMVYADGKVVVALFNGTLWNQENPLYQGALVAIDIASGSMMWHTYNTTGQNIGQLGVAPQHKVVYVSAWDQVWSFDLTTGEQLPWKFKQDWCRLHHHTGVYCGIGQPLVHESAEAIFLNAGGSIDNSLLYAISMKDD